MTQPSKARDDQTERVWAAMRDLASHYPPPQTLRDVLKLGRGSGRVKALLQLAEGPLSLSGLAEALGVDAPYATLIVDTLEERNLATRHADPADRRRKIVELTPEGKEATQRLLAIMRKPPPGFDTLSPGELNTLADLISRITTGSRAGEPPRSQT